MNKTGALVKLGDIANATQGQSPESKYYSEESGTPFLQGNRTFGHLYPTFDTYTSKVTKTAKQGEVLMSVRAPVGDLNIAQSDLCIGRGLASLNSKVGSNYFIYYSLKNSIANLQRQGAATTYSSVNKDIINDFDVIVPKNNNTWDLIARILFDLDTKIELNYKLRHQLEAVSKLFYDYWFVQFDFPDNNGKPYKSSGGKMVWNDELKHEIPLNWTVSSLDKLANIFDSKRIPLSNTQRAKRQGNYPYYGATGIMDYINDFIFDGEYILVAEDGSVEDDNGYVIVQYTWGKTWVNNHAHVLQAINTQDNEYLFQLLTRIPSIQITTGSVQKKINQGNLMNINYIQPDKDTLKDYSRVMSPIRNMLINSVEESSSFAKLRDWLLPMLMNGQLQVKS